MKYLLAIISLTLILGSQQQTHKSDAALPMYPYNESYKWWLTIPKKQNNELVQRFVKVAPKLMYDEYTYCHQGDTPTEKKQQAERFIKAFTVVDINGDGIDDLIYTGESGGEPKEVAFILNTGTGFKVIFRESQYIKKLDFDNGRLVNVYFTDGGCCEDYIDFWKIYHVDYTGTQPSFKNVYTVKSINKTRMPDTLFDKPVYFEVQNDNYKMRLEPLIQDNVRRDDVIPLVTLKGNTVDTLVKGTRGRAIAQHTDNTGRVWWLVEVDRNYNRFGHFFYDQEGNAFYKESVDKTHKAARLGWISSRYVKRLEE